jgi:hypothetical protein
MRTVLDQEFDVRKQSLMINKTGDHMTDGLKRSVRRKPYAPARPQEAAMQAPSSAYARASSASSTAS